MKKNSLFFKFLPLVLVILLSCRSEFETVRLSNDPPLVYKKAKEYYSSEDWYKSQVLIEQVIPYFRGRPESEELFFMYANTFYNLRQYTTAIHWFQNFSNTYSNSNYKEESDWLLAYSSYKMSPVFRLDQTESDKAIEKFQLYANSYPTSSRIQECNTLIDEMREKKEEKSFEESKLYYNLKQYQAAMRSLENSLIEYPETKNREEIKYLIVESAYQLADRSIYNKRLERFKEAIVYADKFIVKYTTSSYMLEVERIVKDSKKQIKALENEY